MIKKLFLYAFLAFAMTPALSGELAQYKKESRAIIGPFMKELLAENRKAIEKDGPESAIKVCKEIAPRIAGNISLQKGIKLTRVSLKVRNPLLGTADAWEQKTLKQFEIRLAKGEKPEMLETAEIVNEPGGKYFRYMKGIVLQQGCIVCHGNDEQIIDSVKARLAEEYPHDLAVGYAIGQVRGGVSIKRAL